MHIEQIKFVPDMLVAGKDFAVIKSRKSNGDIGKEERELSAHMSLVLTVWRLDMGIPLSNLLENNTQAIWGSMRRWMNIYDDIIDRDRSIYPTVAELKHHPLFDGSKASDTTSDLVRLICSVPDEEKRRNIIKALSEFRKKEYPLNLNLSRELDNTTGGYNRKIEEYKLESSGYAMLYLARVVNILNGIDGEKAELCEKGFFELGRSGQFVDDLADLERDNGDLTNLVINAAKLFPAEYIFLRERGFTRKALRSCQDTLGHVQERFTFYVNEIPNSLVHTSRSVKFFADLVPLYSAFETEPYV